MKAGENMTNQNHKKKEEMGGVNSVVAAVTGVVVGAGVAVAGVVLNDEKNRDKIKEVLTNVKDQAVGYMENVQNEAEDKKGEVEKKLAEGEEKAKKVANSANDTLHNEVKDAIKVAHIK